ncbi:MAG: hypothetical protein Q8R87_01890, partial [Anaerolineaceae bacterium]|nr:hypothetical protein [Anaerolineaceae bacterium]
MSAALVVTRTSVALGEFVDQTQFLVEEKVLSYLVPWSEERIQDVKTLAGIAPINSMDPVTAKAAIDQY